MPNTDAPKPNDPKPDEPQGVKRADAELASAYERIKTAKEELARLDQLVSGMEHGNDRPPIRQRPTGAEPGGTPVIAAPPSQNTSENQAPGPGVRRRRPMLLALVGLLLAVCIVGAAFASRYRDEAKAIMARWAPPASMAHEEPSKPAGPALMAQAADAPAQPSPPATPSQKETKEVPSTGATPSAACGLAGTIRLMPTSRAFSIVFLNRSGTFSSCCHVRGGNNTRPRSIFDVSSCTRCFALISGN